MPSTRVSLDLARVRASAPAGVDLWPTLTLEHPQWAAPYYMTSAPVEFTATLETPPGGQVTFRPFAFSLVLPTVDGAGQQEMTVTLTNADMEIAAALQLAHRQPDQRITATYRLFLSTLGSSQTPQAPPLKLAFDTVQILEEAVSGVANRSDVLNRRFPAVWYDIARFPGLDR